MCKAYDVGGALTVKNRNWFRQKFTRSSLHSIENARFTKCQKPVASLSLIPFSVCTPQSVQQQEVSSYTRHRKPTTRGQRCLALTLHRFNVFHLEPWTTDPKGWVSSKNSFQSHCTSSSRIKRPSRQHISNGWVCPLQAFKLLIRCHH